MTRTNVPAAIDGMLGRDADIDALGQWLSEHRLATVLGAGGIGKTRLAQAVARASACLFPDGAWWVDVAALSSAERLLPGIASATHVQLADGDGLAQLVRALAQRQMLLVLDNCEHLAAEIAHVVSAVLAGAAGVRVLATSQEALKAEGEHLYLLSPLAVPPVGVSLATARGFAAVQLLEQRARAVDPRFALTEVTVNLAIDLCRQLDGVALAIEMAAARMPLLGVEGLHKRLGDRLNLLRASSREMPSRQRTLRATLDWSHGLLDASERTVLRRLAVYVGSFRLDAAQDVAAIWPLNAVAVLDALAGLVEKSLVQLVQLDPPRYRLAETTRLYAWEQLCHAGESDMTFRYHDEALVRIAREVERSALPATSLLDLYSPDYEDVSDSFDRAVSDQNPEVAAAAVLFLRSIDHLRGDLSSACQRIRAIDTLKVAGNPTAQARLSFYVAACSWFSGRVSQIDAAFEAVRLWREIGDDWELYRALALFADVSAQNGAFEQADRALAETVDIENPSWPARWRADRAFRASSVAASRGHPDAQRDLALQAQILYEQAGARSLAAIMRLGVAGAESSLGHLVDSVAISQMAVDELRLLNQPCFMGVALAMLCQCSLLAERPALARAAAAEALPLLERINAQSSLVDSLALLAATSGHLKSAALLFGYADERHSGAHTPRDSNSLRVAGLAHSMLVAGLGSAEHHRLRAAGALLGSEQVSSLAQDLLADKRPPVRPE